MVRDYWGAEQTKPLTVNVEAKGKNGERFLYAGTLDLSAANLEIGRYYELHGAVPRAGDEPFRNFSSFAILPEAVTKQYKPEDVPFTSRDWDNRIGEYLRLADRIGIRVAGLWGTWSETPPYNAEAPGLEIVEKAGMGWLTGTPAGSIERGETKYDEAALRGGVRNLIEKFGHVRPLIISLGNEPHGTGAQVLANVNAYRVLYEEIKKVDPTIYVVATSVEPNEEYFKAGYGKYCDAYDFHIYEDSANVRAAIAQYQALMKKYDVVKPIWSTELGLNSQGIPRNVVAGELIKKFSVFFAAGGANVSWFDFLYPDSDGTNGASSGAAHDVFDSRFNRYAPKLTAIAYYNMVNAIAIKKFVAEKEYADGIHAFLFRDRDGKSLQVLWKDQGRADIALPLPNVQNVQLVRLDGSRHTLSANNQSITASVSDEPILVLYDGGPNVLPSALAKPSATIKAAPTALRGGSTVIEVALDGANANEVNLVAPAFWTVKKLAAANQNALQFAVSAPETSAIREADYTITLGAPNARRGELYVRTPVSGKLALQIAPVAKSDNQAASVKLIVTNNGLEAQTVNWDASLANERAMAQGVFGASSAALANLGETSAGSATIAGKSSAQFELPLNDFDAHKIYRVRANVSDASGQNISSERFLGGMAQVVKAKSAPKLDGVLDEAFWQTAPVQLVNEANQMQAISAQAEKWKGPQDLSANLRYAWDARNLYIGAQVTDDIAGKLQAEDALWASDGLQLLIDPTREKSEKPGKYDIALGIGKNGPKAWFHSSADANVPTGLTNDVTVSAKRQGESGSVTYEIAIPWSRLAPFQPRAGANLGLSVALNEDDGKGRFGFMGWFGDVQSKSLDDVGDLILSE